MVNLPVRVTLVPHIVPKDLIIVATSSYINHEGTRAGGARAGWP